MKEQSIILPQNQKITKDPSSFINQKLRTRSDPKAIHEHKSPAVCNARPAFEAQSFWAQSLAQGKYEEKRRKGTKGRGAEGLIYLWDGFAKA